jgi:glutathione S-transferase
MKLYYAQGACSLAVHIALRELGVPFELVAVDLASHRTEDGADYFNVSPRGYVPLLQLDDGSRHAEAASLLQYLADLDPSQSLIGATGSLRRLAVVGWLAFVSTELHKVFSPWLWQKATAESTRRAVEDRLSLRFAELDKHLSAQEYLAGTYSVADAYVFTILNWTHFLGLPLTPFPHLQAYMRRVAERPSVRDALLAEGLVK